VLTAFAVALLVLPLLRPAAAADEAPQRANVAATIVAAGLPLIAFAFYFWASDWPWEATPPVAQESAPSHDLKQMVGSLQQRLSQQPDDLEGWKLLGRSAAVLGDFQTARAAYSEAYTRSQGQDPDAVAGFAEALVLTDERELDGQAAELFEKVLTMAPQNSRALWYGGIVASRRGDPALAQQRLMALQNQDLPPELRQMVAQRLSQLQAQAGATVAAPAPAAAPTAKPVQAAGPAAASAKVLVQLAPALAAQAPANAMLFLIARRGEGGPPIAVVRRPVSSWPFGLTISDADAMLPGTSLAGGGPVRLIARISRSGQPAAASGDLFGEVSYDFTTADKVTVTIDRIVP
jgi:cytochrome c-type biogenesis protein CcmH